MSSLVIFGSRKLKVSLRDIEMVVDLYINYPENISEVLCGMCRGPDMVGKAWADIRKIPVIEMPADWDRYGLKAGPIRNRAMAERADIGIGFWDGRSTGTVNMAGWLTCFGKKVFVFEYAKKNFHFRGF